MGRLLSELSPVRVVAKPKFTKMPLIKRAVVQELPAYSSFSGCSHELTFFPDMCSVDPSICQDMPIWERHSRVDLQSSFKLKFVNEDVPSLKDENKAAR